MPKFTIQVPDGRKVTVQADNQDQAIAGVQDWYAKNPAQPQQGAPQPLQQRLAGQQPSSNIEDQTPAQAAPNAGQRLMDSTAATVNGLVNGIPVLGPLAQNTTDMIGGGISQLTGGDYGDYVRHQQALREGYAKSAPAASLAGNVGGALASFGGLGALPGGAEALGIDGAKILPRLAKSFASTEAIGTADNIARGKKPVDAAVDSIIPALVGGIGGPLAGEAVGALGGKIAKSLTGGAQKRLTDTAIKGAPTAAAEYAAGSRLFENSTTTANPMISDTAMMRFVGDVRNSVAKYRPNEHTTPHAVGLLQHMMELADAANTPGVAVDLKDLHILRETANAVRTQAGASDTSKTVARDVVKTLDKFINGLKPGDILGGADPSQAANDLMKGISTWARASKVAMIENAVKAADTYKSGFENGLKLSFLKLMRSEDFARFSALEKEAIRKVAKGTTTQNIAEGLGKLGFSLGGNAAHNVIGGTIGTSAVTGALAPFLGPLAFPAALGATSAVGAAGRAAAERLGTAGANRAAQIVATPRIPMARQVPNRLLPLAKPIELLIRGGAQAATR